MLFISQSGRSRGFGFVYYEAPEDAREVSCEQVFSTARWRTNYTLCDIIIIINNNNINHNNKILVTPKWVYFSHFQAKQSTNGLEIDGRRIRVDYSITKRAHTPTPGVYMGKATQWVWFLSIKVLLWHTHNQKHNISTYTVCLLRA